jgi:hypothetical protein
MSMRAGSWPVLRPLLDIRPRVLAVMYTAILAVVAARLWGRAVRSRLPADAVPGIVAGRHGGDRRGVPGTDCQPCRLWPPRAAVEPLTEVDMLAFLSAHLTTAAIASALG